MILDSIFSFLNLVMAVGKNFLSEFTSIFKLVSLALVLLFIAVTINLYYSSYKSIVDKKEFTKYSQKYD